MGDFVINHLYNGTIPKESCQEILMRRIKTLLEEIP